MAQEGRFAEGRAEGLLPPPSFNLLAYEAVNLADGRRSPGDIAAALAAEFLVQVDGAWVARLLRILAAQGLMQAGTGAAL